MRRLVSLALLLSLSFSAASAVRAAVPQLYWSQTTDPLVGRVDADGSGTPSTLPRQYTPLGLATVAGSRQIYWYEHGQIMRSNADLTDAAPAVSGIPIGNILNVAVDPASALVFWTDGVKGSIGWGSLASGTVLGSFPSPGKVPDGIAVDPTARKVYWETQSGAVFRANYDGSGREGLVPDGTLGSGAIGIDLDLRTDMMYLAYPNSHRIARAHLDGTGLTTVLTLSTDERPFGIDVFGGRMYWADGDVGRLRSAAIDGTGVTTLLTGLVDPRAVGVLPALLPGDSNGDGRVDFADLLILAQHYGKTSDQTLATGDFNRDGGVGFDDLLILAQNYGQGAAAPVAAVPEPSVIGALVAAALGLSRPGRRNNRLPGR